MKRKPRHQPTKAELIARLPRAFRAPLTRKTQLGLSVAHQLHLQDIATGKGTEDTLWQWCNSAFLYSRIAEALDMGRPEMCEQLALVTRTLERYRESGRIGLSGPDYQLAKHGLDVMDALAAQVDHPTANAAADWAEAHINRLAAAHTTQRQALQHLQVSA